MLVRGLCALDTGEPSWLGLLDDVSTLFSRRALSFLTMARASLSCRRSWVLQVDDARDSERPDAHLDTTDPVRLPTSLTFLSSWDGIW